MLYKVLNNKVKFYEIEVDKRIYKIRNNIINKYGRLEHRNIITGEVFSPIEKNSNIVNFKYKRRGFFLYEYDYDIRYYPQFIVLLDTILNNSDYSKLKQLNQYRLPLHIKRLDSSRYKNKLIERDYPYDKYIKEIKACFKNKVIEEIEFSDELQLLNILLSHDVYNKKQLQSVYKLMKQNNDQYKDLIEQLSY